MQTRRDFIAAGSLAVGATLLGHTANASPAKNRRIVLAKRPQRSEEHTSELQSPI